MSKPTQTMIKKETLPSPAMHGFDGTFFSESI